MASELLTQILFIRENMELTPLTEEEKEMTQSIPQQVITKIHSKYMSANQMERRKGLARIENTEQLFMKQIKHLKMSFEKIKNMSVQTDTVTFIKKLPQTTEMGIQCNMVEEEAKCYNDKKINRMTDSDTIEIPAAKYYKDIINTIKNQIDIRVRLDTISQAIYNRTTTHQPRNLSILNNNDLYEVDMSGVLRGPIYVAFFNKYAEKIMDIHYKFELRKPSYYTVRTYKDEKVNIVKNIKLRTKSNKNFNINLKYTETGYKIKTQIAEHKIICDADISDVKYLVTGTKVQLMYK